VALSARAYLLLLAAVAGYRLIELGISTRHRHRLAARRAAEVPDPCFRWMVLLHAGVLLGSALEVLLLRRPLLPFLALPAGIAFVFANALRLWVIVTLGEHWNVQVMDSTRLGIVEAGPFQWIRHPNYVAVFVELTALPLIHTAWLTAACGALCHLLILRQRILLEEGILLADPVYRTRMGGKPRFVPRTLRPGA
jgi:methyltransferase